MAETALAPPTPEAARTAAAFEAAMWALARPGERRPLPDPGPLALAHALLDRETTVCAEGALAATLAATGARPAPLSEAAHVFAPLARDAAALAAALTVGEHAYPDRGATLIAPATFDAGTRLRLTGPGIDGARDIALGGIDPGFWPARAARLRYPLGFEVLLIDGDRVIGLPRTTGIEVL